MKFSTYGLDTYECVFMSVYMCQDLSVRAPVCVCVCLRVCTCMCVGTLVLLHASCVYVVLLSLKTNILNIDWYKSNLELTHTHMAASEPAGTADSQGAGGEAGHP